MTEEEVIAEAMAFGMTEEAAKSFLAAKPADIDLRDLEMGDIRISLMSWKAKKDSGQRGMYDSRKM